MDDKQWDDWLRRREGTLFGDFARKADEHYKIKPIEVQKKQPKRTPDRYVNTKTKSGNSFLPGVDEWVKRHLSVKTRRTLVVIFMIIGALVGSGLSEQLGLSTVVSAILGAVVGALLLPLIIFSIKLILVLLALALAGFVIYLLTKIFGA